MAGTGSGRFMIKMNIFFLDHIDYYKLGYSDLYA